MEIGMYCCKDEIEGRPALKLTRTNNGPETFSGFSAGWTSGALCYMTVNHNETNCPLNNVICGVYPRCRNESKIGFAAIGTFSSLNSISKRLSPTIGNVSPN